jgi:hypothetical protein
MRRPAWKRQMGVARKNQFPIQQAEDRKLASSQNVFADHEYFQPQRPAAVRISLRIAGLISDITLLVLLSPFLAAWLLYRVLRNFLSSRFG